MKSLKDKIFIAVILVVVAIGAIMLFNTDLEHIEDTNGAENFQLQKITDENIVSLDTGALNVSVTNNTITNMTEISSKKFTGVYEVLYVELIGKSDFLLDISAFEVNGGNFKMVLIHNDKIVKTLTPENYWDDIIIEDINGTVSLVIAGESADFSMKMPTFEYNYFSHR